MSDATTKTLTPARRGFRDVPCLKCQEAGTVTVILDDVDQFHCTACGDEFSREDVDALLAGWSKLTAWLDACPAYPEEGS